MVRLVFARAFQRHVECPEAVVAGATIADALAAYFDQNPLVRRYVLDESGAVRTHVAVFCNDELIVDRRHQSDPVADGDIVHVFQALSGGST